VCRWLLLLALGLPVLLAIDLWSRAKPLKARYERVYPGMTLEEVEAILGPPSRPAMAYSVSMGGGPERIERREIRLRIWHDGWTEVRVAFAPATDRVEHKGIEDTP
jgi:hypothetical protein